MLNELLFSLVVREKAKRPTPWLNECIAAKIKEKNYAKQIAVQSGSERDKEVYRQLKNKFKVIICDAKILYLRDAVSKARANPRLAAYMCKCVNGVIGRDKSQKTEFP